MNTKFKKKSLKINGKKKKNTNKPENTNIK